MREQTSSFPVASIYGKKDDLLLDAPCCVHGGGGTSGVNASLYSTRDVGSHINLYCVLGML